MSSVELQVCRRVAVIRGRRHSNGTGSITFTTVERVGKRDVVLANGDRFNKDRLVRTNGTWESPTELVDADDPRVKAMQRANEKSREISLLRTDIETADRMLRDFDLAGAVVLLDKAVQRIKGES